MKMMRILIKTLKAPFALSYFSWISLPVYNLVVFYFSCMERFFFFLKRVTQLLLLIVFPSSLSSMGRLVVKHCYCKRTFSFSPQGNWAFLSGTHGRVDSSITFNVENINKSNWELFFFTTEMVKWKRAFSKQIALPTSELLFCSLFAPLLHSKQAGSLKQQH